MAAVTVRGITIYATLGKKLMQKESNLSSLCGFTLPYSRRNRTSTTLSRRAAITPVHCLKIQRFSKLYYDHHLLASVSLLLLAQPWGLPSGQNGDSSSTESLIIFIFSGCRPLQLERYLKVNNTDRIELSLRHVCLSYRTRNPLLGACYHYTMY